VLTENSDSHPDPSLEPYNWRRYNSEEVDELVRSSIDDIRRALEIVPDNPDFEITPNLAEALYILRETKELYYLANKRGDLQHSLDASVQIDGVIQKDSFIKMVLTPDGEVPPLTNPDSMEQLILRFRQDFLQEDRVDVCLIELRLPTEDDDVLVERYILADSTLTVWNRELQENTLSLIEDESIFAELSQKVGTFMLSEQRRLLTEAEREAAIIETDEHTGLNTFEGIKAITAMEIDRALDRLVSRIREHKFKQGDYVNIDSDLRSVGIFLTTRHDVDSQAGALVTIYNMNKEAFDCMLDRIDERSCGEGYATVGVTGFDEFSVEFTDNSGHILDGYYFTTDEESGENKVTNFGAAGEPKNRGGYSFVKTEYKIPAEIRVIASKINDRLSGAEFHKLPKKR